MNSQSVAKLLWISGGRELAETFRHEAESAARGQGNEIFPSFYFRGDNKQVINTYVQYAYVFTCICMCVCVHMCAYVDRSSNWTGA